MNLSGILALLKSLVPVIEPLGEQGINQLFDTLDSQLASLSSPDLKDMLPILSKALREVALVELRKLKA